MNLSEGKLPEFSRIVELEELKDIPLLLRFTADESETLALSKRFNLVELTFLNASITLNWEKTEKVLSITGSFCASVTQNCVVTLEPIETEISEQLSLLFARDICVSTKFDDLESAEPLKGDRVDVGEIIAEELSLSLNPYPRGAGLPLTNYSVGLGGVWDRKGELGGEIREENPFSILGDIELKR
ncbi:MAG: DUF177 domain-containing protein [Pseudomonadota bacterium]|nr:DUF177 domain-containing protein [Pseudomonadota bacterium]